MGIRTILSSRGSPRNWWFGYSKNISTKLLTLSASPAKFLQSCFAALACTAGSIIETSIDICKHILSSTRTNGGILVSCEGNSKFTHLLPTRIVDDGFLWYFLPEIKGFPKIVNLSFRKSIEDKLYEIGKCTDRGIYLGWIFSEKIASWLCT